MKLKKRNEVFETNSSSVHTLSIIKDRDYALEIPVDKEGNIHAYCGDFSMSGTVFGQQEKLNYLITYAELYAKMHDYVVEDTYFYLDAKEAIQDIFPQVKDIVVRDKEKADFDHQTAPYESDFIINTYDNEQLQQFLFNNNLTVKMERD